MRVIVPVARADGRGVMRVDGARAVTRLQTMRIHRTRCAGTRCDEREASTALGCSQRSVQTARRQIQRERMRRPQQEPQRVHETPRNDPLHITYYFYHFPSFPAFHFLPLHCVVGVVAAVCPSAWLQRCAARCACDGLQRPSLSAVQWATRAAHSRWLHSLDSPAHATPRKHEWGERAIGRGCGRVPVCICSAVPGVGGVFFSGAQPQRFGRAAGS